MPRWLGQTSGCPKQPGNGGHEWVLGQQGDRTVVSQSRAKHYTKQNQYLALTTGVNQWNY